MEALDSAFFFVCDKLISLQVYFLSTAWKIGRTVLLIAVLTAGLNYGLTGQGLKESVVKILKAAVFFVAIMQVYPAIVSRITEWTFQTANDSTYASIAPFLEESKAAIAETADNTAAANTKGTFGSTVTKSEKASEDKDPMQFFSSIIKKRQYGNMTYTVVAPAAAMQAVLLVAGECLRFADEKPEGGGWGIQLPDFGRIIKGLLCGFFVIMTGAFAVLEYLIAFMEYLLVTSVGIILFPLSLWDGSKFMAEKLIGAIIGFFLKLLFCNICIFMMLYGFMTLAKGYTARPFTGTPDEIIVVIFISLLFFFMCKSAPALAQSLLTGSPSLNAAGAIAAVGGAVAGAGMALKAGGAAGSAIAGGGAKALFSGGGALAQAGAASKAVGELGGSAGQKAGAFMSSLGGSAKESFKAGAGDLARSLLGGGSSGGHGGSGAGTGVNRHSERQKFLGEKNADGTKKSFGEYIAGRKEAGTDTGIDRMVKQEQKENAAANKSENA
jgi:hypothetical protein